MKATKLLSWLIVPLLAACGGKDGVCGDGAVDSDETCDDGNTTAGDGCDAACQVETPLGCGDGVVDAGEGCDDGNITAGDGCDAACAVEPGFSCSGVPSVCTNNANCGNGIPDPGEQCDDGPNNGTAFDPCEANCTLVGCGNGLLDLFPPSSETCDDGNQNNNDGCNAICVIEPGFTCTGTPSICVPLQNTCGNGVVNPGEGACLVAQTPLSTAPNGPGPQFVAEADFNGDGKQDIVVTSRTNQVVSVFLGNGDGTFGAPATFAAQDTPFGIVTGDFDGDGKQDIAVTNEGPNTMSVLLGIGDGTFQPQVTFATGSTPTGLVAADLNGDGKLDLAAANISSANVSVFLNTTQSAGNVAFQSQTLAVGIQPISLAAGDIDNNNKLDLVVANSVSGTVSIVLGNGDGTFQPQLIINGLSSPTGIAVGDFNVDNNLDIAVTVPSAGQGGAVDILLGDGFGGVLTQTLFAAPAGPNGIVVGDFDADNKLDLAIVESEANTLGLLLGNGNGTFQAQTVLAIGAQPAGLVAGHFDAGTTTDFAVPSFGSNSVTILLSTP